MSMNRLLLLQSTIIVLFDVVVLHACFIDIAHQCRVVPWSDLQCFLPVLVASPAVAMLISNFALCAEFNIPMKWNPITIECCPFELRVT